ncbi:MAG: peptidyl-prolyl cis-trans isomerase [Burkholderiaceae bacterium]|nr:peptidyl-prolyl cis-trans isomerase [Burkholderiaceae bacterium]
MTATVETTRASVNGVALHAPGETLAAEVLRQRACTELLRQAAQRAGLLAADDPAPIDGATSEAATAAIEALLAAEVNVPEPSDEACRRHFAAHESSYRVGDRAHVRHVLFAVTPGVDVRLLRDRAEGALLDVRCHRDGEEDRFAAVAAELSNCPSGAQGGDLGWLTRDDCAPEFARELFAGPEIGVLPRLVHSRFGLHVVDVMAREAGHMPAFESVRGAVALALRQQTFVTALRQYLQLLAGEAAIEGVQLDSADTPLVQ